MIRARGQTDLVVELHHDAMTETATLSAGFQDLDQVQSSSSIVGHL
jgi:hypothetical protein